MKKCQPRLLTPFIDGELSTDDQAEITEHLQSCPSCGAMLDEVTLALEHVRGMGRSTIPTSALEPALEIFAERAGLELDAETLRDTLEVARDPARPAMAEAVAEPAEPEAEVEGAPPEMADKPIGPGAVQPMSEPTAAELPMVESPLPGPPAAPVLEPMAPPPRPSLYRPPAEEAESEQMELSPSSNPAEPDDAAAPARPAGFTLRLRQSLGGGGEASEDPGPKNPAAEEPLDLHAEAPRGELRPPWLSDTDVEDPRLEADGRAAVDDAIEREAAEAEAKATEAKAEPTEGAPAEAAEAEVETPMPAAEFTEPRTEGEVVAEDPPIAPLAPIPDPGPPPPRPEPRLEPPPEPWSTVWRPQRQAAGEPGPEPRPEPAPIAETQIPQATPEAPEPVRAGLRAARPAGSAAISPCPRSRRRSPAFVATCARRRSRRTTRPTGPNRRSTTSRWRTTAKP